MIETDAPNIALVAEAAPLPIVVADADGLLKLVNQQACELFGYEAAELCGRPIATLLPHLRPDRPEPARGDLVGVRKDGRTVAIEVGLKRLGGAENGWLLAAVVDVSERVRAHEHLRKIIDSAPNAKVLTDERGRIALVNAEAERLFGYNRDELVGCELDVLVPQRFRAGHEALRESFLAMPVTRPMGAGRDLYGRRKDGTEVSIEIGLGPISTPEGRFVLASIHDITERKHLEALRLANAGVMAHNADLEALNAELESFSYTISHDLRAPLRAMAGFARMLRERHADRLDPEGLRLLGVVQSEAARMDALIDEILELARLGRERMQLDLLDMNEIVAGVVRDCIARSEGADLEFEVEALPSAYGDRAQLRRVWENLLSNAVKFSSCRAPARIHIFGEAQPDRTIYHVRDNGIGFDMRYVHKLFGVFARLHPVEEVPGTGVGLAIAHRVVTRHQGRIWAEAEVDRGATFSFTLPVVARGLTTA